MKNILHILTLALLSASCAQLDEPIVKEDSSAEDFSVYLTELQTKTVNNGMSTLWAEGDRISLFHAPAGTEDYVNDLAFVCDNVATNKFSGSLAGELTEPNYDWYACYPYTSGLNFSPKHLYTYIGIPKSGFKGIVTQNGNDSMEHLVNGTCVYPLVGNAKQVSKGGYPEIIMKNVASVIAVNVTNGLDEPVVIESVDVVTPKDIVGGFNVDFSGTEPVVENASYCMNLLRLEVKDGLQIEKGKSAKFYIGAAPFTAAQGSEMRIYLNGKVDGKEVTQRIAKTMTSDMMFKSGTVKTINVTFSATGKEEPIHIVRDDLKTMNLGQRMARATAENRLVSFDGWEMITGRTDYSSNGGGLDRNSLSSDNWAIICGNPTVKGKLTSPLIADGCGTLTIKYCPLVKNTDWVHFRIDVLNAAGEVKWTDTVGSGEAAPEYGSLITYSKSDINVNEPFRLVISNLCPQDAKATNFMKNRILIYSIEWTAPTK